MLKNTFNSLKWTLGLVVYLIKVWCSLVSSEIRQQTRPEGEGKLHATSTAQFSGIVALLVFMLRTRMRKANLFGETKDVMQGKLFQKCTHLLYCSVLSLGGNVNTRRMSQLDTGSIFHIENQWNILVKRFYNLVCIFCIFLLKNRWQFFF